MLSNSVINLQCHGGPSLITFELPRGHQRLCIFYGCRVYTRTAHPHTTFAHPAFLLFSGLFEACCLLLRRWGCLATATLGTEWLLDAPQDIHVAHSVIQVIVFSVHTERAIPVAQSSGLSFFGAA